MATPHPRKDAARAIAATAQGGFVRTVDIQIKSHEGPLRNFVGTDWREIDD